MEKNAYNFPTMRNNYTPHHDLEIIERALVTGKISILRKYETTVVSHQFKVQNNNLFDNNLAR